MCFPGRARWQGLPARAPGWVSVHDLARIHGPGRQLAASGARRSGSSRSRLLGEARTRASGWVCACVRARGCADVCMFVHARAWLYERAVRARRTGASGPGGKQEAELCRLRMNVLEGAPRGGTERQRRGARSRGPSAGAGAGGGGRAGRTRRGAGARDSAGDGDRGPPLSCLRCSRAPSAGLLSPAR